MKTVVYENYSLWNVGPWNVRSMKCPVYEMSGLWNVWSMKCLVYEMSGLWNIRSMNCTSMKCPSMKCPSMKCPNAKNMFQGRKEKLYLYWLVRKPNRIQTFGVVSYELHFTSKWVGILHTTALSAPICSFYVLHGWFKLKNATI